MTLLPIAAPGDALQAALEAKRRELGWRQSAMFFQIARDEHVPGGVSVCLKAGSEEIETGDAGKELKAWFQRFSNAFDALTLLDFCAFFSRRRVAPSGVTRALLNLFRPRGAEAAVAEDPVRAYESHLLRAGADFFDDDMQAPIKVAHSFSSYLRRGGRYDSISFHRVGCPDAFTAAPKTPMPDAARDWLGDVEDLAAHFEIRAESAHARIRLRARTAEAFHASDPRKEGRVSHDDIFG